MNTRLSYHQACDPRAAAAPMARHFGLDPEVCFLNHGSFGATPLEVRARQDEFRALMEREPVRFFVEEAEPLLDEARAAMAAFVGCDADDFAFVANATAGVNTVVRSLRFAAGDEVLTSSHEYNACNNAVAAALEPWGGRLVSVALPFPVRNEDEIVDALLAGVTPRTRLVLLSHVTSPTGIILPVKRMVALLAAQGIDTLVDGAHAPGYLPLDVASLGSAYYTGNFHKWVCAPKGSAFLYVRRDRQPLIRPLIVSHGANSPRTDRSRFRLEFDYVGSTDLSAWLATPAAVAFVGKLHANGWPGVMAANRDLAIAARDLLCRRLGAQPPVPDSMLGAMAAVPIAPRPAEPRGGWSMVYQDPLWDRLTSNWGIQVPIWAFPAPPQRHVRISAQVYNRIEQYEYLAEAIAAEGGE